jgi:Icc protein
MLIAQITDTHIQAPGGRLDRWYDTAGQLERAIEHLNALNPAPDLVLLTGDSVDGGSHEEYSRLREILSKLQPPLYVIPGNHDNREEMRRHFLGDGYLPLEGYLQYSIEDWPVRLVGLDTLVMGESGGFLCEERLDWLDKTLGRFPKKPTVIFQHHPPFQTGLAFMDAMGLENADELGQIITSHKQVVHIVAGHLHRPITASFSGVVTTVCPSTAHQMALDLPPSRGLSVVMEPPAASLLWWNEKTEKLVHHLSYTDTRERHLLHDGTGWCAGDNPPEGFYD